jgi:hypothetical protein
MRRVLFDWLAEATRWAPARESARDAVQPPALHGHGAGE